MSETRATRAWHKCNTSAARTTRVRHECYMDGTSATRVKNFDFDNDTSKNIFSYPYIYYMASGKIPFGNASFPWQNVFKKCTTKTNLFNGKIYIKTFYTRLYLQMPLHVPAWLRTITQRHFRKKIFYVKIATLFLARTIES